MAEEIKKLSEAFSIKEENERFLLNLEKLKAEGSLEPDVYLSMKADYKQRLDASLLEIDLIKGTFKKQLETLQREQDIYKNELNKVEARYKTGELTLDTYQGSIQNLRATITQLEHDSEELKRHIATSSSADSSLSAKEPSVAAPKVSESVKATKSARGMKLPGPKLLAIGGGIIIVIVLCILLAISLIPGGGATLKEVKVPVDIKGATNIGSLHLELTYDATMLNVVSVDGGALLGNAIFKYGSIPGRVVVGMVSSSGIKGDGSIIVITFLPQGKDEKTIPLALENITVYDGATLTRLPLSSVNGSFEIKSGAFTPPLIIFNPPSK